MITADAPSLAELQRDFQRAVAGNGDAEVSRWIIADATAGAQARLRVYSEAYGLRLVEVLTEDFPVLKRMAGDAGFVRLCEAYIAAHPSTTRSVRWFGRRLDAFLEEYGAVRRRPVLAEIASFEWARGEVFDAEDMPALSIDAIAAVPPEQWPQMRFVIADSVRRLDLRWNVPALCQAVDQSDPLPRMRAARASRPWLIWRDSALDIRWRRLAADEAAAFDACRDGHSFGAICELLCSHVAAESAPLRAATLLKRWVSDGLLTRLQTLD